VTAVDKLVYLLPVLGCMAMMGLMVLMMRGSHASNNATASDPRTAEEIAALRAEIADLRAQQRQPADRTERGLGP
jgi:hypothetical protein